MLGAVMLFLPECFGFMGRDSNEVLQNAEYIGCNESVIGKEEKSESWPGNCALEKEDWRIFLNNTIVNLSTMKQSKKPLDDRKEKDLDFNIDNVRISIVKGLKDIAKQSGLWISAGGIHEAGAPSINLIDGEESKSSPSRVYNTHLIIDTEGHIKASYRKIHLFDVSIPSKNIHLQESKTTAPGSRLVVCESPIGKLGLSTCYDLRFGEMYTELAGRGGADILLVPSAFTVPTGKAHWHTLLRGV